MVAFLFLALFFSHNSFAQSSEAKLERAFSSQELKTLRRARIGKENVAFAILDLENNRIVDQYNGDKLNILASVSKLYSTFYGLKVLGPDFQFQTKLSHTGKISGDHLRGDLVLTGTGDPLFDSNDLFDFAKTVHSKGITTITGNIYVDDSYFFKKREVSNLGLGDQTYNPAVGPVAINFNRFVLYRNSRKSKGKKVTFIPVPNLSHIEVINDERKFPAGKRFDFDFINTKQETWAINQKESYKKTENLPIRRPSLFAGHLLKFYLIQLGIPVQGKVIVQKVDTSQALQTKKSVNLKEIVKLTLEYSNNLLAENILLRAAREDKKVSMPIIKAAEIVEKNINGGKGVDLINGSGLTSENRTAATTLVNWLANIHKEKFRDGSFFWPMLSLGGHNGWIRDRFLEPEMAHRVWGKTGSLDYVNNIAGYLNTSTGKWYAYAIFVFDEKKRGILDDTPTDRIISLKRRAPAWKDRTGKVIEQILRNWYYNY